MSEATTYWDTNVTAALLGGVIGFAASTITVIWTTYYVRMVHNGLRHSFCSYRLAVTKSAAQVALEAGSSPKMLFENYRELVTEKDALAYFGILPNGKRPDGRKLAQNLAAADSPVGAKRGKKLPLSEEAMAA